MGVVSNILKRAGMTFFTAGDAREAQAVFAEHGDEIDLLVTDVMMPETNGRELYERLRALRPELPVVFVSGFVNDPLLERAMDDAQLQRLVEKPFGPTALLDAIETAMREARTRRDQLEV